jgi:hypothetical protein
MLHAQDLRCAQSLQRLARVSALDRRVRLASGFASPTTVDKKVV